MKKVDKVEVLKNSFIRPKYEPIRNKVTIKNVNFSNKEKIITFLNELPEFKSSTLQVLLIFSFNNNSNKNKDYEPQFDPKLLVLTVQCKDNVTAKLLFSALNNVKFEVFHLQLFFPLIKIRRILLIVY